MVKSLKWVGITLAIASIGKSAHAQTVERVSVGPFYAEGNHDSFSASVTSDGWQVAFASAATNLATGDTNGFPDVFVRNRLTGTTERISVNSANVQGNGASGEPSISADGRFVAFSSTADNLVHGDTNGLLDVFVRDRQLGTTERVSVSSTGTQQSWSGTPPYSVAEPCISSDGRYVVFESPADNLVSGDTNGKYDVFLRDRQNNTTVRISVDSTGAQASGDSVGAFISGSGQYIAFQSGAADLVAGDTLGFVDVFVRDTVNNTTTRVSVGTFGAQGTDNSWAPCISSDGHVVSFHSDATNLVAVDTNAAADVFIHNLLTGITQRVSVSTAGLQCNAAALFSSLSEDGRYVAFLSAASNLVAGDTNGTYDVFVHDCIAGTTTCASTDINGIPGNGASGLLTGRYDRPQMCGTGGVVAFQSAASNLVTDTNGCDDVFVHAFVAPPVTAFCFGDGTSGACPCANTGAVGHGCENTAQTGGASLSCSGSASLGNDTLLLISTGELPAALSVFLQGNAVMAPLAFNRGLQCVGGNVIRLYTLYAVGGTAHAPGTGGTSVSATSSSLGDPLAPGMTRYYQTYYHDPIATCPPPNPGGPENMSGALAIYWTP